MPDYPEQTRAAKKQWAEYKKIYDLDRLAVDLQQKIKNEQDKRAPLEDLWREIYDAYHNQPQPYRDETSIQGLTKPGDETDQRKAKLAMPLIVDAAEEMVSQLWRATFPTHEEFFRIDCDDRLKPAASIVSQYVHKKIRQNNVSDLKRAFKIFVLLGTAFVNVEFRETKKRFLAYDPEVEKVVEKIKTVFRGIDVSCRDNFSWLSDTSKPLSEGMFFYRFTLDHLKLLELEADGYYHDVDKLQENPSLNDTHEQERQYDSEINSKFLHTPKNNEIGEHVLWECWGDHLVWNKKKKEYEVLENTRVYFADYTTIIGIDPNPNMDGSLPGIFARLMESPDPRNPYGISIIGNSMDLYHAANRLFNVVIDGAELSIKNPQRYNPKDASLIKWMTKNGGRPRIKAGTFVPSEYGLDPLISNPFISNLGFQVVGEIKNLFSESTKSIKNFTQKSYQKTATEIAGILEQVSSFLADSVSWIQLTFVGPFLEKWWNTFLQYQVSENPMLAIEDMNRTLKYNVIEKLAEYNLGPQSLFIDWDFVSSGNNFYSIRLRRIQQVQVLLNLVAALPGAVDQIKIKELLRYLAREMELSGFDDVLLSDKEWQQTLEKKQQEIAQMQASQKDMMREQAINKAIAKDPGMAVVIDKLLGGLTGGQGGGEPTEGTEAQPGMAGGVAPAS